MKKSGLPPVAGELPRILILGSFPGEESLRRQQYYANPRNQFWRIIFSVLGTVDPLDYEGRTALLAAHHVALWDVIASCERSGSADGSIRNPKANDVCLFLEDNPTIEVVCLNGGKAAGTFRRLVSSRCTQRLHGLHVVPLPSTSPANARQSLHEKSDRWRGELRRHVL